MSYTQPNLAMTIPSTGKSMPLLALLTVTSLGVRAADGVRVARAAPQGYVLTGPLCGLPAGDYELVFRCQNGAAHVRLQPVLGVQVVALTRGSLIWRDFTEDELTDGVGTLQFRVAPELDVAQAEMVKFSFKFFHYSNADIAFTSIELRSIPRTATNNVGVTRVRLLYRFATLKVAERKDGHVLVSRKRRPGCFLAGPMPIALPEDIFRLSVHGSAQHVRSAGQPVLGVEVQTFVHFAGHPRGLFQYVYRDFTAEELALGSASFDFVARQSLGDTNQFRFELYHFGNADLDLESVELAQCGQGEGLASAVLRRWRLTGRLRKLVTSPIVSYFGFPPPLSAIYPRLKVVAGFYRLSIELAAPFTRSAMDVEIVATDNWRPPKGLEWLSARLRWRLRATLGVIASHRVSIEEQRAGKIVCDFEAPPELSYDGEHVWIDLRFVGAGIGGVGIRNLEISSRAENQAPIASESPNPRTLRRSQLVIYGNCQAYALSELLRNSLSDRFSITFQFLRMDERESDRRRREFERADILLIQDVADWKNNALRAWVPNSATIVGFPHLRLASLWPFDELNGPRDAEPAKMDWPENFHYRDGMLGRLRKTTPDPELRFARYAALEAELVANPVRLHQFEARRLAAMDRQFECRIGHFIVENYQHRRLFHTTSHPNGDVLVQLLDLLATRLDTRRMKPSATIADRYFNWSQVPIHPKVAKLLGVTWADENTLYRFRGGQITWEAYIREYIRYYG